MIRLQDALQIIAGTWNDNAKLQAIAKLDDGSYLDKNLEKLVVEAEADAAWFQEWEAKQDEIGMPKQDKRPPKPQPVAFSTKHLSTMTEAEAKDWIVQAAKYLTAMPSVNEDDNYVTDASGRKHGDQVGLSPQTDGPVRSFVDAYDDLGEELPSSYFLAAASYLRLHAGSEGEDGQLNNAEWSEAFDALKNVVSEDSEDTRLLLKADVQRIAADGASTREGYWNEWKSPRGNTLVRVKAGRKQGVKLTTQLLRAAGLTPYEDFQWDKDTWEIIVQPDALPKFIAAIEEHWPTLAATMRTYTPPEPVEAQDEDEDEDEDETSLTHGIIAGLTYQWDRENFRIIFGLQEAGIHGKGWSDRITQLGGRAGFKLIDGSYQGIVNTNALDGFMVALEKMGPQWAKVLAVVEQYAPEWAAEKAELKQSREEGRAEGGSWRLLPGKRERVKIYTDFISPEQKRTLGLRYKVSNEDGRWGYIRPVAKVPEFADTIRPLFPRLAEALSRAYGGINRLMDEDVVRCAPLIDLSNKLEPSDLTNEVAQEATREVIAAFNKRGPTNGFRPYGYQINGIAFAKLGGYRVVIGDAMGLGKTMQALGAIIVDPDENLPCLVVAPASVLYAAWSREAKIWLDRILPARDVVVVDKPDKLPRRGFKGVCIVSWAFIGRSQRVKVEGQTKPMRKFINVPKLEALGFNLLIADEAHYAKTGTTSRAKALIALAESTPHVLLLTGTPIKNVVSDLWALLKAVQPDIWGTKKEFQRVYAEFAEQGGHVREVGINMEMVEDLRQRLACSMIRRFKQDAMPDIPPMTRKIVDVGVSEEDRAELDYLEREFEAWLTNEIRQKTLVILEERGVDYDSLSPAQQHALSMGVRDQVLRSLRAETLVKLGKQRQKVGEIKAKTLGPLMARLKAAGEPTIFWAHHKAVVKILERTAKAEGLRVVRIDGSTPSKQRGKIVDLFQAGEIDAIIATMAAKEGLTLTAANRAYFVERYWTPADESQAEARIWRIGQTRPSTNYFLAVPDSIDQYMEQLVSSKRHLIDDVVGDETIEKEFHEGVEHAMADLVLAGVMRQS
jgi:SWI/SNF-related matrix-associated actin-dependent regulator 1 of chromatin subfamily A